MAELDPPTERAYDRGGEDAEQAKWLAKRLDGQWRYDHTAGRWHHWDSVRWAPDKTQLIRHVVVELARDAAQAIALDTGIGEEERKQRLKIVRRLFERNRIDSALVLLASDPAYATDGHDWDQNPYLLGCANGVVDLRKGDFTTPDPADLVTRSTGVDFVKDAKPPARFVKFLGEITSGDEELSNFYMMWFGYSLFGLHDEHRFLILTGLGRNGKGALVTAMRHVFGEYSAEADQNLYMKAHFGPARSDQARADLMQLKGKRLAAMSEPDGQRFNEEMLKSHTGGDPITARALHSNNVISWLPTHTITFLTNTPPTVDDIGPAMASRVMVADFRERFDGEKEDKQLYKKLEEEAEGILSWLVKAAKVWYDNREEGIQLPPRVVAASEAYITSNDPLGAAIEERFVIERGAKGRSREMYAEYLEWHAESGRMEDPMSETAFAAAMKSRGFVKKKTDSGAVWQNIRPKSALEVADE